MAQQYASIQQRGFTRICNEPCKGATREMWKFYASEVIPSIRSYDKDAVILDRALKSNWSRDVDEAVKDPVTGYDNIMYTLHFYAATHKEGTCKTKLKDRQQTPDCRYLYQSLHLQRRRKRSGVGHRFRKQLDQPARQLRHQLCVLESGPIRTKNQRF